MTHLSRDDILARRTGRGTVELPGGGTVAIRALTRDEILAMDDLTGVERSNAIVAAGMTDPALTAQDVAEWGAQAAAGDLTVLSEAIGELSGLRSGTGKVAYKRSRGRPGS